MVTSTVSVISCGDIDKKDLFHFFLQGAKAVRLEGDDQVRLIWSQVVEGLMYNGSVPFWESSLITLGRNHRKRQTNWGDMALYFSEGVFAHIARKVITFPDERTGRMRVYPESFYDGEKEFLPDQDMLWTVWDIASDIYRAGPRHGGPSDYAVSIALLKYPDNNKDIYALFDFLADSGEHLTWKKIGGRVDSAKSLACGPFSPKGVRDAYAWMSLAPILGPQLRKINERFRDKSFDDVDDDWVVIGPPHADGRALTMLMGDRNVMRTELYDGDKWVELPLSPDSLTILPGRLLQSSAINSTIHRYSIKNCPPSGKSLNLSLALGIVDRKSVDQWGEVWTAQ